MAFGNMEVTGEIKELFQQEWCTGLIGVGLTEYGRRNLGNSKFRQLFWGIMGQKETKNMGKQVVKSGSVFLRWQK